MALEDGQDLRPIGSEKVDRTFDAAVARDSYDAMYTAVDPQNKLVFWVIPGAPGLSGYTISNWSDGPQDHSMSAVFFRALLSGLTWTRLPCISPMTMMK